MDEATKAEVEVKAEEEAFNGEGVEGIPVLANGSNGAMEVKPEPAHTALPVDPIDSIPDVKAEDVQASAVDGDEMQKPKRGRPRGSGKAKP